jgi:DNA-binding transcriptional MerR regulator
MSDDLMPDAGADKDTDSESGAEPGSISIGEVLAQLQADFPDVSISKIRFLESRGLVSPHRAASGYRRFHDNDVDRLRWILTMQRDHFLPLRVIKERLETGAVDPIASDGTPAGTPATPQLPPRTPSARFHPPGPAAERLDAEDLVRLAGITSEQLADLTKFGLVESITTDQGDRYEREELSVAKAAGAFLQRGIEARHLKAWRLAAEREASMLAQIVTPMTHQNAPDAVSRAREVADDLIDRGNTIRETIIVKSLREGLGFDNG